DQVLSPVECPYTLADGGQATLEIRRGEFMGRNQFGSVFPHPTAVPVPEEIQLTPAVARFLGLYAAEGFTSRNGVVGFAIATYEEALTEFITSSMKNVFHTNPKVTDTTRHRRRVWCCSKALAKYFDEKFGRKAWNKHFPEEFVTGPLEIVEGLLRGLWEGDESYACSFGFVVHNSAGINLPARRVIIRDLNRYDVNFGLAPIPVLEIKQMCGRAGRPKYDKYGEAILFAKDIDEIDDLMDEYFRSEPEAIESKLGSEPALRMHVLASVATGHVGTEEDLLAFFNRTFYAYTGEVSQIHGKIREVLDFLAEEEVTKKFGIGPGDIRRMTDQGEWLLYSMAELGRIFNKKKVRALTRLTTRVQYGVKEELLELISLKGVGRVRGRALFQRGFRT